MMKKLSLVAILAWVAFVGVNAQEYKWWIGGQATLWSGDDVSTAIVAPEIGYHLSSKFTVAASVGYHSYNFDNDIAMNDYSGFVLSPYLRYNAFRVGILSGYVDGGVEFGLGDFERVQVGLKPGVAIHLTNRFCVAFLFGFVGYSNGKDLGYGSGVYNKGFGLDFSGYRSGFACFYSF